MIGQTTGHAYPGWSVFEVGKNNWQWSAWAPNGSQHGTARTREEATRRAQAVSAQLKRSNPDEGRLDT